MPLLRNWFPPKTEAWRPIAEELGGTFVEGAWSGDRLEVPRGDAVQTVTDDQGENSGRSTQVSTPVDVPPDLKIVLFPKSMGRMGSAAFRLAGLAELSRGDLGLAGDGTVMTQDAAAARAVFAAPELREAIAAEPSLFLYVGIGRQAAVSVPGFVGDRDRLAALLRLHDLLLDGVAAAGWPAIPPPD